MTISLVCFYSKGVHARLICIQTATATTSVKSSKHHMRPTLHHDKKYKYWINLSENVCGSCLDTCLCVCKLSNHSD